MPKLPSHKYVVKNYTLYIQVDDEFYKEFKTNRLVSKKDLVDPEEDTDDLEMAIYRITCSGCEDEKSCHEEAYQRCLDDEDSRYFELMMFAEEDNI